MSFSSEVKRELSVNVNEARHCQLAELAAVIIYAGRLSASREEVCLSIENASPMLKTKYGLLLSHLFGQDAPGEVLSGQVMLDVLESVKMWDAKEGRFRNMETADGLLVQQSCCRRAFIRGAFLACGSMSNPGKAYHFEIVCRAKQQAIQLQNIIRSFDIDARIVERKKSQVVYVKEGEHIVDLLNIMEAHEALMNLENVRIVKEMRNSVNRRVNCETANISKTVGAAVRQMEDILWIQNEKGLESLPDHLREIAALRLQYPDAPLAELGTYLSNPVGKSGVNHRLRRISEIAESMGRER